jgi:hypothetical protein
MGGFSLTHGERVALTFIAHNDPRDGFVRRTWLEFKTAICGLLQRTRSNGWVSVNERLPAAPESEWEDSVAVLGWSNNNGSAIAHYVFDKDCGNRWSWECVGPPSHWMPLPEPPVIPEAN